MATKNKKAAIELSIGTVVIIVLAMSMLILGLVLVRNIFSGATDSVDEINEGVKSEIKKLFQDENDKAVIRLSDSTARVKQGDTYNFAFGVRNNAGPGTKTYQYRATATSVENRPPECPQTLNTYDSWVSFGSGTFTAGVGEVSNNLIRLRIPENAPLCTAQFRLYICTDVSAPSGCGPQTSSNNIYESLQFFVQTEASGIF